MQNNVLGIRLAVCWIYIILYISSMVVSIGVW